MRSLDRISGSQLGRDGAVRILCGAFTTHTKAKIWDEGEMCILRKILQVRAISLQIRVKGTGQMGPTEVLSLAMKCSIPSPTFFFTGEVLSFPFLSVAAISAPGSITSSNNTALSCTQF